MQISPEPRFIFSNTKDSRSVSSSCSLRFTYNFFTASPFPPSLPFSSSRSVTWLFSSNNTPLRRRYCFSKQIRSFISSGERKRNGPFISHKLLRNPARLLSFCRPNTHWHSCHRFVSNIWGVSLNQSSMLKISSLSSSVHNNRQSAGRSPQSRHSLPSVFGKVNTFSPESGIFPHISRKSLQFSRLTTRGRISSSPSVPSPNTIMLLPGKWQSFISQTAAARELKPFPII